MVTELPELYPTATLKASVAVVKFCVCNASVPTATDLLPFVSVLRAFTPITTLKSASVRDKPATPPMSVLRSPVVTAAPALGPTATLYDSAPAFSVLSAL